MKKFIATILSFILVITTVSVAFAANSVSAKTALSASVKTSASPSSKTIAKISKNHDITVNGYTAKYYKVICKTNNKTYTGYVAKSNVKKDKSKYVLSSGNVTIVSGSSKSIALSNLAGTDYTKKAKWTTSNSKVATVSYGKITSVGIGSATVSAKYGNKTLTCSVTVNQAKSKKVPDYKLKSITPIYSSKSIGSKKVATLKKGTILNVVSKDKNWFKVTYNKNSQKFTGYIESKYISTIAKTVHTLTKSITAGAKTKNIALGKTENLVPALYPRNATEEITWKSSNTKILSVSSNGTVKAVAPGCATITVTSGTAKSTITLNSILKATSVRAVSATAPLAIGESINAYEYIKTTPTNAYDVLHITSSSDEIAHISGNKIYGKAEGTVVITLTESGHKTSFMLYVHPVSKNAAEPLQLGNAYGDNINYHAKCLYFENGWNGYKYWITYSPYKDYNDYYENPHIMASNDMQNWEEPKGFHNPLEPQPDNWGRGKRYNSDPELVYNSDTKQLECWWRYYSNVEMETIIYRKTTSDGVHWNEKENMLHGDIHKEDYLSPALVYENGKYKMWSVDRIDSYKVKYMEYSAALKLWSGKRTISIVYPEKDLLSWHLGVIHTPNGYEMSISAFKKGQNHNQMNLYYAYSKDNITYTRADIMLKPSSSADAWDNRGIYRSTMMYADGKYYLFYSGLNKTYGPSGVSVISGDDPYNLK